jgi:uncharacterized protein
MKNISKILVFTLILASSLSVFSCAINLPEATNEFFVNDFANVINDDIETELQSIGVCLYEQTTAQVVVVTVDSLDGYDVDEYALELGREWGVGSEENNGIVLLMSVNDRQVTIQVGYGLEGCLPDGKTGRILDTYAIPYLSENDFSTGLSEAYKAIVSVVCEEYGVELSDYNLEDYNSNYEEFEDETIVFAVAIVMVISLLVFIITKCNGNGSNHGGGSYYGGPVYRGGFNSGGYRSGGGFSSGGFRGGGGSFGGGGASRGF